jgi:2,3-bisphosphoglycerate-independent phosphoglycerate mutase
MDTCSENKEVITDTRNEKRMIEAPKAFDFLKLTKNNCLYFNQSEKTRRVLNIQQEFVTEDVDVHDPKRINTFFDTVYKIRYFEPDVRELLIIESLKRSKTQSLISELVNMQKN